MKHQEKIDDDFDDTIFDDEYQKKQVKCLCCKEFGHLTQLCEKDPNIKTKEDPTSGYLRIMNIPMQHSKKLFAES